MNFKLRIAPTPVRLPKTGRYSGSRSSRASRSIARRRSMSSGGSPSLARITKRGKLF